MHSVNESHRGSKVPLALELATAIGLALMAGFLFNMSVVTAPALDALSPEQALAAWKGINSTVRNPLFAGTAFGTAVLVLACAVVGWRSRLRGWCVGFALLYVIGVIGTTFVVEAGINRTIVLATAPPPELPRMLATWLLGNHIRAVSALAAFVVAWLGFRRPIADRLAAGREKAMLKKNLGNLTIGALIVMNIVLWLVFGPVNDGSRAHFTRQLIGEVIASTAVVLIACAMFLSTRFRFLEPYFGGLDQMYQSHKRAAMMGIFLLLVHIFTVPLNASQVKPGTPLGVIAFLGLLALVLLTIAPRIPVIGRFTRFAYDKWRRSHRLIGIFFIIGFAHAMLVDPLVRRTIVPFLYLFILFLVGAASYLYAVFIAKAVKKTHLYVAEAVSKLNGTIIEVTLKPQGEKLGFTAGQFIFIRFEGDRVLAEPHPFTVSSAPQENNLRVSIKASGDWTQYLYDHLKPGMQARVDGAYGMFNYKTGGKQQIWVAGGIGLTPFLSWIRDFKEQLPEHEIDFYYCMRVPEDALFLEEVEQSAAQHKNFRAHVSYSNKEGHLSVDQIVGSSGQITGKEIYLCGPIAMINSLQKGFIKLGLPASQIHFEEFNFR